MYKLNEAQLEDWGQVATEIRKKIVQKSENYQEYAEVVENVDDEVKSRR